MVFYPKDIEIEKMELLQKHDAMQKNKCHKKTTDIPFLRVCIK